MHVTARQAGLLVLQAVPTPRRFDLCCGLLLGVWGRIAWPARVRVCVGDRCTRGRADPSATCEQEEGAPEAHKQEAAGVPGLLRKALGMPRFQQDGRLLTCSLLAFVWGAASNRGRAGPAGALEANSGFGAWGLVQPLTLNPDGALGASWCVRPVGAGSQRRRRGRLETVTRTRAHTHAVHISCLGAVTAACSVVRVGLLAEHAESAVV